MITATVSDMSHPVVNYHIQLRKEFESRMTYLDLTRNSDGVSYQNINTQDEWCTFVCGAQTMLDIMKVEGWGVVNTDGDL